MDLFEFKKILDREGVIFSLSGTISQSILINVGEMLEKELEESGTKRTIIHNIFAIMTEQMQNVMSYSMDRRKTTDHFVESSGLFVVGYSREREKYFVSSCNRMYSSGRSVITQHLERINSLGKKELKAYYREVRRSGRNMHDRGAGLGFIEMAKRSSEPLEYSIYDVNEEESFFQITVYVG
jgi:hypothetical protein